MAKYHNQGSSYNLYEVQIRDKIILVDPDPVSWHHPDRGVLDEVVTPGKGSELSQANLIKVVRSIDSASNINITD